VEVYRIVIADDHVMFRQGMKALIDEKPDLQVVGEAGDGFELLKLLDSLKPDMVILDISMPGLRGIEITREIKKKYPRLIILVLTMHKNKEYLYHALSAGAKGYVLKEDSDVELFLAIDTIRKGGVYVTQLMAGEVAEDISRVVTGQMPLESNLLTDRETQVLKLLAEGLSNREIADLLHISTRTVENHRDHIKSKLNINNTAELVKYAIQKGLTDLAT
jgi:DNA-binding NarL/FixJ family response regulator